MPPIGVSVALAASTVLLAAGTATAATSAGASSSCPGARSLPGASSPEALQSATLCLLNRERTRRHLPPLRLDGRISSAAQRYAQEMVGGGFMSHFNRGAGPSQRIARAGYRCRRRTCPRGEDIAWAPRDGTPEGMVALWMHSAGHRYNILYRGYGVVGVGVAHGRGSRGAGMYVADFAGS